MAIAILPPLRLIPRDATAAERFAAYRLHVRELYDANPWPWHRRTILETYKQQRRAIRS